MKTYKSVSYELMEQRAKWLVQNTEINLAKIEGELQLNLDKANGEFKEYHARTLLKREEMSRLWKADNK